MSGSFGEDVVVGRLRLSLSGCLILTFFRADQEDLFKSIYFNFWLLMLYALIITFLI